MAKKGDTVFYIAPIHNHIVQAKVLIARRTGRCKVQAEWFIRDGGVKSGPFLGFVFDDVVVYPNAKAADDQIASLKRFT